MVHITRKKMRFKVGEAKGYRLGIKSSISVLTDVDILRTSTFLSELFLNY